MSDPEFYFELLGELDPTQDTDSLFELADELQGQIVDNIEYPTRRSKKSIAMLSAQKEATWRVINRKLHPNRYDDTPHPYEIDFASVIKNYTKEAEKRGLPKKTVAKTHNAFGRFSVFIGRDPTLPSITRPQVIRYWREQRNKGLAKSTVSNDLTFLGAAFQSGIDEGYVDASIANPFKAHRLDGFAPKSQRGIFSQDQLQAILHSIPNDKELKVAVAIGYYTGMRISEIFTAKLVRQQGHYLWSVAEDGGKTASATRHVPVSPHLRQALKDAEYWPKTGEPVPWKSPTDQALGKRFGRAKKSTLQALGFDNQKAYTFHSLRHGFVTQLIENGYSELEIADLSGHSKNSSTTEAGRTYSGLQSLEKRVEMVNSIPEFKFF